MKVCLLTRYFDLRNAGIGRVSIEIAKELERRNYDLKKVSTEGESLYSYFFYTLAEIPMRVPLNCDVYHAITPMEGMWLPKKKGTVTFHDLFQITNPDKLGSGIGYSKWKNFVGTKYFKLAAQAASRYDTIVAVSEGTRDDLMEYLHVEPERIRIIRSGIYDELEAREKPDNVTRVGFMGQLDRRKRADLLIEAFQTSSLDELVIAGKGADESILRATAGDDSRIKFIGLVTSNWVGFYNSLDVFVLPTWLEGYGLPIVEAMACKKPVIVLKDARIPTEVKSRCAVVEYLPDALRDERSLRDACASVDLESNYEWAKTHKWSHTVDQYIQLYEEIASR